MFTKYPRSAKARPAIQTCILDGMEENLFCRIQKSVNFQSYKKELSFKKEQGENVDETNQGTLNRGSLS